MKKFGFFKFHESHDHKYPLIRYKCNDSCCKGMVNIINVSNHINSGTDEEPTLEGKDGQPVFF